MGHKELQALANMEGLDEVKVFDMMMQCLPEDAVIAIKVCAARAVLKRPSAFLDSPLAPEVRPDHSSRTRRRGVKGWVPRLVGESPERNGAA